MSHNETAGCKAALIVGGGNGLGAEIAKQLSVRFKNKKLIIADKQISNTNLENSEFINIDLSYEGLERLYNLDIDMLIVTAGFGRLSKFETFTEKEIEKGFAVNTLPSIKLISAYYDKIKSSQNFFTCVISSITGIIASPLYSVYSSTKAALVKFVEAVNAELEYDSYQNRILNVAPGHFSGTGFHGETNAHCNQELIDLANAIIDKTLDRELRYIPKYDEVYKSVMDRYQTDSKKFAQESIEYKYNTAAKINDSPQVKVGYLTGTFDLFHIGHLNLLKNAKKYCDKLIVGVHPTAKHKNKEVFIPLDERMEILKNIGIVDDVIVCSDEDIDDYPILHYDFLFVGSDYKGTERFNRYEEYFTDKNVQIIYLPYTTTTSSTQLRNLINSKITKE